MSRLSLADIDEVARLQRKILHLFVWIDQLIERERFPGKSDDPSEWKSEGVTMRDALPGLLDDITNTIREIAAIVNRDDEEADVNVSSQTRLGTVVLFDASDDTVAMIQALLAEAKAGQSLISCPFADVKRGITDFRKYLHQHNPEVVIVDLSPPYDENWAFFTTMRDAAVMQGRGVVLTTTSKQRLDDLIGEDSHAIEVVGAHMDRALILEEIKAATRLARTARRQANDGAL